MIAPGPTELLIVLGIAMLLFGTKRIRQLGSDLGGAVGDLKKGLSEEDKEEKGEESDE